MTVATWAAGTNGVIGVLGSSVAKGWNGGGGITNGSYAGGYMGRLMPLLEDMGWAVTNVSTPGDNTSEAYANIFNKLIPADPDYAVVGLSLANEGLVYSSNRDATYESFRSGLTNILHTITTNGIQPAAVTLVYPAQLYTWDMYDYVKRMNLLINAWNVPSANLVGALNDERGRWVYEYISDNYHPTADGHAEFFHSWVPTLFSALAQGKTARPELPPATSFMRAVQDGSAPAPVVHEPDYTMHSFALAFDVRTLATGTVAAVRSDYAEPLVLVDFGSTDPTRGRPTPGPDTYGRHWNSWQPASFSAGTTTNGLLDTAGATTGIGLEITSAFTGANGSTNGYGLFLPEGPDPQLLGPLAIETATEDYFYTSGGGELTVSGLDTNALYTLRIFACRESSVSNRVTQFELTDRNVATTYPMITSGPNVGRDGASVANNQLTIPLASSGSTPTLRQGSLTHLTGTLMVVR